MSISDIVQNAKSPKKNGKAAKASKTPTVDTASTQSTTEPPSSIADLLSQEPTQAITLKRLNVEVPATLKDDLRALATALKTTERNIVETALKDVVNRAKEKEII